MSFKKTNPGEFEGINIIFADEDSTEVFSIKPKKDKIKFQYASFSANKDVKELQFILENRKEITHATFKRRVDVEDYGKIKEYLGYEKYQSNGIALDKNVKYYSSILKDETKVYYLEKVGIQYIFYKNKEVKENDL